MPFCDTCNLKFSAKVFERHLERDHELDRCRVCAGPVLEYHVTPLGNSLAFCSSACIETVRRRGICFVCFGAPVGSRSGYLCATCRRAKWATYREQARILADLRAIERAARLPGPYQRADPNAWKFGAAGEEDVA
jgi:hypothetical protein